MRDRHPHTQVRLRAELASQPPHVSISPGVVRLCTGCVIHDIRVHTRALCPGTRSSMWTSHRHCSRGQAARDEVPSLEVAPPESGESHSFPRASEGCLEPPVSPCHMKTTCLSLGQWFSMRGTPPRDIWQCLETFFIVTTLRVCYWHLLGRAQGAAKRPTINGQPPTPQKLTQPNRSAVPRCRHPCPGPPARHRSLKD